MDTSPTTASTLDFAVVDVPCAECGDPVGCEVPVPPPPVLTTFCSDCRQGLLDGPSMPAGYDLVDEVGRGGMGAVYRARHRALGLERAVKLILPQGALSQSAGERFLHEARLHARLRHPHVVQVLELAELRPGLFALVMEYVPGGDASRLVRENPAGAPPALAIAVAGQALEALGYVHTQGILHCDVKDPNLLLSDAEVPEVKLADFGLARLWVAAGGASRRRTSVTSGTIPYMSPEQAGSLEVTPRSDLFSLGATLYRLLCGSYPHDFPDGCDRLAVAREGRVVPLAERRPDLPATLAAAVDRALAPDPAQRYADADAMREALLGGSGQPS